MDNIHEKDVTTKGLTRSEGSRKKSTRGLPSATCGITMNAERRST